MAIYEQKPKNEKDNEATAFQPSSTGAKLTSLATAKPVPEPKHDAEINTNKSMEELAHQMKDLKDVMRNVLEMERRKYPNFIHTYELSNTTLSRLAFGIDTNNSPILKIRIIGVGAGLFLGLNGEDLFVQAVGDEINGEIRTLDYQVQGGKAYIQVFARIDK